MLTDIGRKDETTQFLEHVFGYVPESMLFYVWTLLDKVSHWCKSRAEAARFVSQRRDGRDVYLGIALAISPGEAKERVQAVQATGIVGFVADIDYQHEARSTRKSYPPTFAQQETSPRISHRLTVKKKHKGKTRCTAKLTRCSELPRPWRPCPKSSDRRWPRC